MKNVFITTIIAAVIVGGSALALRSGANSQPAPSPINSPTNPPTKIATKKIFTLAQVTKHDNREDCWLAIEGKVYDVTPFIASGKHPGKDAILQGCGKDATELYNTRPMGSKTPHSAKARELLPSYYIGDLK